MGPGALPVAAALLAAVASAQRLERPGQFILFRAPFSGSCANISAATWEGMLLDLQAAVTNDTAAASSPASV